jgi:serine protease Do
MFKNLRKEYYKDKSVLLPFVVIALIFGFLSGILGGALAANMRGDFLTWIGNSLKNSAIQNSATEQKISAPLITEEDETMRAVRNVMPATVNIVISKLLTARPSAQGTFDYSYYFPSDQATGDDGTIKKTEVGGGSGFVISSDGLILTNKHVVADASADYSVILSDGKKYAAKVIARDAFLDLAVLKIEAAGLPVIKIGNSDKLALGQTVIAIGYSLSEYQNTVTKGIISGIKRHIAAEGESIEGAIQTDAAINPGNSGGPLINLRGEVVGINTAINTQGQLLGFSIPINGAKNVINSVKKFGRIVRPWLGVRYYIIDEQIKAIEKLPVDYGALILHGLTPTDLAVIPGSPADIAGIKENDIVLEVNGVKINADNSLSEVVSRYQIGDTVNMTVMREGKNINVKVLLEEFGKNK